MVAQTLQDELRNRKTEIANRLKRIRQERAALLGAAAGSDFDQVGEASPGDPNAAHLLRAEASIARQLDALNLEIEQDRRRIKKMRAWLTAETIGGISIAGIMFVLPFVIPYNWIYALLVLAGCAFLPLLLGTLIKARRTGWLAAFVSMVILPCGLLFVPAGNGALAMLLQWSPVLLFYIYCWSLRLASDDWGEY